MLSCILPMLQAAQARAQEAEASLRAVRAQAEQAKQQAREQQAQLEGQLAELKQQLQGATTAQQLQVGAPVLPWVVGCFDVNEGS